MKTQVKWDKRIASMFIDHMVMSVTGIFFFIGIVSGMYSFLLIGSSISFALYFCKDSFAGRSIGKRVLKFQVINARTGQVASPLRCLMRNFFIILWPIEVIVTLISPQRRIGDFVAGTKVVNYDQEIEQASFNSSQITLTFFIALGVVVICMKLWLDSQAMTDSIRINPSSKKNKDYMLLMQNTYDDSTLNQPLSMEATKLCQDSFNNELTASVSIFDRTIGIDTNSKYILCKLLLKKNYWENDDSMNLLELRVNRVLSAKYPPGEYVGQLTYKEAIDIKKSLKLYYGKNSDRRLGF